jgi:hypothetical protein
MNQRRYALILLVLLATIVAACSDDGAAPRDHGTTMADAGLSKVGEPCATDPECGTASGRTLTCMKLKNGVTWTGGYCLLECDTKSPQCPSGSVCGYEPILTALDRAYCFRDCTGSQPDCRTGYWCSVGGLGVCYPKAQP